MADKPRRILEKSKTVRRRYQRSNKRFQFTASQIERIEREEERERRAAKLREKEKKLREKKKKKAEREAKAREERKRLGLPDPNAPKVSSSQPLLVNFFGAKKSLQPAREEDRSQESGTEYSDSEEGAGSVNGDGGQDASEEKRIEGERADADRSNAGQDSEEGYCDLADEGDFSEAETVVLHNEENVNDNTVHVALRQSSRDQVASHLLQSLGDSFEDDTSRLLQDLLPDELDVDDYLAKEESAVNTQRYTAGTSKMTANEGSLSTPKMEHPSGNGHNENATSCGPPATNLEAAVDKHSEPTAADPPEMPIDIYQDPEDILAGISTQDLTDGDDDENDDFDDKENLHPNIVRGQRPQVRNTPRRPKPYSKLQASAEREPLSLLNRDSSAEVDDDDALRKSPSLKPRQKYTPRDMHKIAGMPSRSFSAPASHPSVQASLSRTYSITDDDDEFGDLDLSPEELEALGAL
ncbi:hypothetical protein DTO207G8_9198 [Paecilomyces variotii]|nr:hypothetical protein DTO169C6_2866 [Paecilomyces variotii]KAJ9246192.1 hypothetical protein DTO207G8_9198 [Paecilomyces variotii]KAJ9286531.1 hypothetical protein DTO021C3_5879 [Paecilomyces variotii]KAJ9401813.1 hypothetical protein DTO282F9_1103 [Paecilomyces variotii]